MEKPENPGSLDFEEGDFLYTRWGYEQTNTDFAKIVEVSDTRKTVVCRRVKKRRLKGGNNRDKKIMPKDEPFGDKFRLHVRKDQKDRPRFTGSYPYTTGKKQDRTRKDTFQKWTQTSTRQTRRQMGH